MAVPNNLFKNALLRYHKMAHIRAEGLTTFESYYTKCIHPQLQWQ